MSSNIWKRIQIGSTLILLSLLCFSHLALALGDSENEAEADLLHRHIRDVQVRLVPVPNLVPENVSNDVTLYNVSLIAPNRNYIVTNSSAGVNSMFQVTSGLLKLRSTLPADQRKLFDYEKFKTFDVTITCTNQTDPTDVIILTVRLALSDVNDEPPVFTNKPKPFLATVVANPSPGTVVFTVTVIDPDTNANIIFGIDEVTYQGQTITGRFQYNLLDGGNSAQKTYNIITAGSGALTQGAEYNIKITAQDMNTATGQQLTTENIYVLVGNRPPQFFEQSYKGRIYENTQTTPTNWVLEMDSNNKLLIRVMQFQPGNQLTYQLLDQGNRPSQLFDIQPEDNAQRIVNRMALDYETITFVSLIIKVTEAGTGLTSTVSINIIIIDENDHSPTFFAPQYTATIREDVLNGTSVLTVTATDLDSGPYGEIIFSILNSTSFDVTTSNTNKTYFGTVIVKSLLDFDSDPRPRQFSVIASDKGTPALSTSVQTTVFLQNVNDNPPTIVNTTSTFYLNETSQVNTIVTLIQASDIDGDSFQFYFERKSATSDIFTIRPTNGQIILNSAIPKDINSYILIVIAVDEDNCCGNIKTGPKTATATFTVNIVDINVNKPSFNNCLSYDTASVKEMSPAGTPVIQVSAFDPDRGQNGVVLYRIETPEANTDRDVFQINSTTGEITVKRSVSRDNYNVIQLTVVGRNPPSFPLMEGRCTFRVTILDINNNPPTFSQALYTIPLSFSTKPPYIVTQMAASDKDVGDNANITYSFGMNDTVALRTFSIHPLSGVIQLNQTLNQSIPSYILIVVANDNGKDPGPLTGNTTVNVTISFDQRQPPVWLDSAPDNAAYDVSEDSPRGYVITTLACQSNLSNTGVEFRVFDAGDTIISESKNFYIVTFTDNGVSKMNLSLRNSLDYETTKKYTLSIVCQSLSADVLRARLLTRVINVLDANDEVPEFLGLDANGRYRGTVAEDAKAGATVLQISAQDNDNTPEYRTVSFTLGSEFKDFFQVNPLGNNRADIVTTSLLKLDRENVSQYTVEIVAQDGAPSSLSDSNQPNKVSRFIDVIVTDVNDNPPRFDQLVYIFNVSENAPVSYSVGVVKAFDPDEIDQGLGLDYRFTSGNKFNAFNIIPITGEIRLAKKLDYDNPQEEKEYSLTLIAVDSLQLHTATTTVEIFINDENDNRPIFSKNPYRVENKVTEEDTSITPQNPLFLVQVNATDADVARPNAIRYSLFNPAQSNVYQFFTVDAKSGNVSLIGPLDRDIPPYFYTITVKAEDEIVNPLSNFADVLVYPLDINDNDPEFNPQYLQNAVREHTANVYVMTLSATDKDNGVNGTVHYKLAPDQPDATLASMFEVRQSGEIYTTNNVTLLDRETIEFVYLAVVAYDLGTPSRFNSATATISLIDINDQPPFFEKPFYSVSVSEHLTSGRILTISAKDLDSDPKNREMIFSLETSSATKFFTVESIGTDAVISVTQAIDYETDPHEFNLTLRVNGTEQGQTNTTRVQVIITDYNDNPPKFNISVKSVTLVEEEPPRVAIANFTATDLDEGVNAEIEYFIDRKTDPRFEYYIDPTTGVVTTRKRLDREVQELITLTIWAVDKGEIPLTGTATLSITLTDINDNAPRFRENYRPVVPENVNNNNLEVVVIYATDPDTRQYGPPFGFRLPDGCSVPACKFFTLTVNEEGDGGNRTATVRTTNTKFDREQMKYYYLPIVMWDMDGNTGSMTATNTLTITIGDENDNTLEAGNQNILVYNYEGQFENTEIGRVYVEDPDDWDLPDKTFTYASPDNLRDYFSVDAATGMVTMKPGVPPNNGQSPYQIKVQVFDKKFQKTVTSTVSIIVQLITDETVRKSGGVRLEGITADEFVKPTKTTPSTSRYTQFREAVSKMLGYPSLESIEIVSLTEGEGFLDVWFSAHASPYVSPSQGESAVMLNKAEFEQAVGLKVLQVPINLCMEENSDIGCYNLFNVTGQPELVNSNGTSYVMMRTTLAPEEGCVDGMFPDPIECRGDYCFNGGTCIKDDWGKLSCACSPGFDGPRCQQLRHSFDGTSATFYKGLSACAEGRTSIDFVTVQEDGLIMYSGPVSAVNQNEDALDYLILELKAGYPFLRLNLGGQEVSLELNGKDVAGTVKMQKLSDGVWHHLDIDRDNQRVTLTVDHCDTAAVANGTVSDWSPCRISRFVPGPDVLLNVKSLLQLGGRYTTAPAYPSGVTSKGFNGCLKNLKHNTKLYDLYYKELPSWKSGNNGCPREETICGQGTAQPVCGQNATCEANWQTSKVVSCRCYPGWYGTKCAKVAPTKDLRTDSFFAWQLTQVLINDARRKASFQMMYRTRQITGTLFVLTNAEFNKIVLELVNGKLSLSYNMGKGDVSVVLTDAPANTGQWATVRVERYGNEFLLILDGGEGRYYAYQTAQTNLGVLFEVQPLVIVGAQVTSGKTSNDLASTCVRDIRFNDYWLPLTQDQNSDPDAGARLTESRGIQEGCVRDDCGPSVTCRPGTYCYPLWEAHTCRCTAVGTSLVNDVCVATCVPNPCYNYGVCSVVSGKPVCMCPAGWGGPLCETLAQVNPDDAGLGAGAIAGIVIAILVLLILLILLLCFLLTRKRSEKEKFIEVDPDDDYIRENVMFYDEEGAGEEDHAAYDLRLLQRPVKETDAKPVFSPVTESEMRARNAPRVDRPDIAPRSDRPDVGTFIKDRINEAENDDPLNDSTREYNFEGGNSDAGSLSSLNTSSSGGSQDYDYLSDWGPKFAKLADMYGAGQNLDDV
ncbi:hypothetical protein BsWGS_01726 [Bradybaena similaris]